MCECFIQSGFRVFVCVHCEISCVRGEGGGRTGGTADWSGIGGTITRQSARARGRSPPPAHKEAIQIGVFADFSNPKICAALDKGGKRVAVGKCHFNSAKSLKQVRRAEGWARSVGGGGG